MSVRLKRIYEPPEPDDGFRVLVDRVWPRGVSKEAAAVDRWLKEIGPTDGLRQWFGHRPERFDEFAQRYRAELDGNPAVEELRGLLDAHPTVTLLFGAKDEQHNQAVVLARYLDRRG